MTIDEYREKQKAAKPNRKKHDDEEHRLQCSCVRWFNYQYRELRGRLIAVPNAGRRSVVTGARMKAEGMVAGVADLILLKPNKQYGALLIEWKTPKGYQSPSQREWEKIVTANDEYKYIVVRSLSEFINAIKEYLKDVL